MRLVQKALTFDDVLLVPAYSEVLPRDTSLVTLLLDITKMIGFFAVMQLPFGLTAVAAILTIIGYSINDKVVVYDRMRENLRRYKQMPLRELIDLSINETLSRTI